MNRRILKKKCKQAMARLIEEHRFEPEQFSSADGEETIDAPNGMERRFVRRGFMEPGLLKGTPVLWLQSGGETPEWDCHLPTEYLSDLMMWSGYDPQIEAALAAESDNPREDALSRIEA